MKIGFTGLLTLLFITLKLINIIDWSWIWVLSPIWLPITLILLLLLVYVSVASIILFLDRLKNKPNSKK